MRNNDSLDLNISDVQKASAKCCLWLGVPCISPAQGQSHSTNRKAHILSDNLKRETVEISSNGRTSTHENNAYFFANKKDSFTEWFFSRSKSYSKLRTVRLIGASVLCRNAATAGTAGATAGAADGGAGTDPARGREPCGGLSDSLSSKFPTTLG